MAFREYKIGARMFGVALGSSMAITLILPTMDIAAVETSHVGLDKELSMGRETGFNVDDPFLLGWHKPLKVLLTKDPKTGQSLPQAMYVYVYEAGTPFPSGIMHPRTLGHGVEPLSVENGKIESARKDEGAVFDIATADFEGKPKDYIENLTALKGWTPEDVLKVSDDENVFKAGAGKTMFVREGCWWCHTLLPEQTQDWQSFGAPPMLGDFNGESPTAFGSDRKGPDLLHVGSRNASREWMMLHFFNPRLVQPHSIMPRFDYLWGPVDANGNKIDYAKWRTEYTEYSEGKRVLPPEVPTPAKNSDIRYLIDYVLSLK